MDSQRLSALLIWTCFPGTSYMKNSLHALEQATHRKVVSEI